MARLTPAADDFLALAKYKQVYLKITPINVTPKSWGKGAPDTFFGKLVDTFGAERIGWGSNFPNSVGTHEGDSDRGAEGILVRQVERSGLDLRQDRALALSEPEGLTRRRWPLPAEKS